ncbi:MAG TPA: imidazoleglycerol-phosphate dehydratase [Candidatus Omnitrophota bacterium]|nr:imidazoleglycerol-phosphate dehydratase [Candidatus Omnitrophota bacterium]HPD85299.1 imidazoleglycerol-phosphate dehydratase [Candidatus Omnitrophota bacterium]HRZ04200.1 imidazoleglycerol-phosphate dehydratase [Candidatus Omnitrophota bacterium]
MKQRKAQLERKSKETEIKIVLNVDGQGKSKIKTNVGILDHMLELFSFHGFFDLDIEVKKADLNVDIHHTNEDVGIVLGKAFKEALGEKEGIKRFGFACVPMEATLADCIIDISGRGFFKLTIDGAHPPSREQDGYAFTYLEHFFESFAHTVGATIHIRMRNVSDDLHTNLESVFKAFGLALDTATRIEPKRKSIVPSTKGIID